MSARPRRARAMQLALLALLILLLPLAFWRANGPTSAQAAVEQAWDLARASGSYRYHTVVDQTISPAPSARNAGRGAQRDQLIIEGSLDHGRDLMELSISQNGSAPAAMRVEQGQTYGRSGAGDWAPISASADSFAPGGDLLGFLSSAVNVRPGQVQERSFAGPNDGEAGLRLSYTGYQFELNGTAFASFMRERLEQQLRARGKLPPGLSLDTAALYRDMRGQGQLWVDQDGLPRRLTLQVELPGQRGASGPVSASITTDFSDFNRSRIATAQASLLSEPGAWLSYRLTTYGADLRALALGLLLCASLGVVMLLCARHWRSRRLGTVLATLVISSMLVTPQLQAREVVRFSEEQHAAQADQEQAAERAAAQQQAIDAVRQPGIAPHQPPTAAQLPGASADEPLSPPVAAQAASSSTSSADSDGDGLSDDDETSWGTCPSASSASADCANVLDPTDSDADGLSDGTEAHRLTTYPTAADTDGDSIVDTLEVNGFSSGGQTWYLDPSEADTNKDALVDSIECPAWLGATAAQGASAICQDSDADGTPDVWDDDNDNDGVADGADLSPFSGPTTVYDYDSPLRFSASDLQPDLPVFVDLQIRPTDTRQLGFINNVLDWPSGDTEGQITRYNDTTFANTANAELRATDSKAANGDVRLVPLLEITIPYQAGHYGNLPVNAAYQGTTRTLGVPVEEWLDTSALTPYGVTVRDADETSGDLLIYQPLTLATDDTGGGWAAFSTRTPYWPSQSTSAGAADWGSAHEVRVIWLVQMLTDACIDSSADAATCEREDTLRIIHAYKDEGWRLSGMEISEQHGLDVAIVYEDPALDTDLNQDNELWAASWNLSNTFMRGRDCQTLVNNVCQSDGQIDVTVANVEAQLQGWSGSGVLQASGFSYTHTDYLATIMMTETVALLESEFTAYAEETIPSLLFLREETTRKANLDSVASPAGTLAFDLSADAAPAITAAFMSWTTYRYDSGAWAAYDDEQNLDRLAIQLAEQDFFQAADSSDESQSEAAGKLIWAQTYFTALAQGLSTVVAVDTVPTFAPSTLNVYEYEYAPLWPAATFTGSGFVASALLGMLLSAAKGTAQSSSSFFARLGEAYTEPQITSHLFNKTGTGKTLKGVRLTNAVLMSAMVASSVAGLGLVAYGYLSGDEDFMELGLIVLNATTIVIGVVWAANIVANVVVTGSISAVGATSASKAVGASGLLVAVAVTWALFVYQALQGGLFNKTGSVEFGYALAAAIASTIVIFIFFLLDLIPVVGSFIVMTVYLIDALLYLICECKGVQQRLTEWIASTLYDVDFVFKNLDSGDRLDFNFLDVTFSSEDAGFTPQNGVSYSMAVTNTMEYGSSFSASDARRATFRYALQDTTADRHADLAVNQMRAEWDSLSGNRIRTTAVAELVTGDISFSRIGTGINRDLGGLLYLSEAYVAEYQGCWMVAGIDTDCTWYDFSDSNTFSVGEYHTYDILPETLSNFARLVWNERGALGFPVQADLDGDGLVSSLLGGADPADGTWDADGDGLTDYYEITNGLNAMDSDSDNDLLTDIEEVRRGLDTYDADSDDDGLSDGQEWAGWRTSYQVVNGTPRYTWVWPDPFDADADADTLDDKEEFYYGFNPWISTDSDEILNTMTFAGQTVVERYAPKALLRFEAAEGAVSFTDSSGQGATFSCETSALACPSAGATGRYGSALLFDGANDQLATTSGVTQLATDSFTIAAWVKTTGSSQAIVTKSDGDSSWESGEKSFYLNASGQPTFVGWGNEFIRSSSAVNDGAWHHIAVVWAYASGTSGSGKIYVDGVDRTNAATTTYAANRADNATDTLAVGRPNWQGSEAPNFLRGTLDELAIFGRALSASQIGALHEARYNGTDGMVQPGDLLDYSMTVANSSANWPAKTVYYGQVEGDFSGYEEIAPAARWKLNEASGATSFSDASGNGRTATCSAATCPTAGAGGYRGAAISLDGGDAVNLDAGLATTFSTGYAFGGWVYPTGAGTQNYQRIAALMNAATSTSAGDLINDITYDIVDHSFKSRSTSWDSTGAGDNTAPANQWYHVMVVVDLVSGVNVLYQNGQPLIDGLPSAPANPANRAMRLGDPITSDDSVVNNNGTLPFQGKIDDFEVYNRVLTREDVQRIMVEQLPRIPSDLPSSVYDVPALGSATIAQSFQVPTTQLSGTFRLSQLAEAALDITDETAVVYDPGIRAHFDEPTTIINLVQYQTAYSGIASDGLARIRCSTANGGTCPTLVEDVAGNAAKFNGTTQYASWESNIDSGPWAIGVWVKPTYSGNGTYAILGGDLSTGSAPSLFINSSNQLGLAFAANGSWITSYTPGGTVPRTTWSHVAATHDGAGNYQLYLNGAAVGNDNAIPAGTIASAASTTYLGRIGTGYNLFQGMLDNLVTFKVKLSASEVRALSTLTDLSLHSQYNFDDPPGDTTFTDLAGVLGDGSCAGAACPTMGIRGKVNRAARFDGNDLVSAARLPLYWQDDATEYSLAAWVKVQQGVIAEAKGQHRPFRLWNNRYDNGYDSSTYWDNYDDVTLFTGPAADEWAHLVVTYGDNNSRNAIYLNGVKLLNTAAGSADDSTSTLPLRIGDKLIGYIDEVQYYNRALSAAEALTLYQTSAPILQFEFEEDTGATTFDDQSDNDADGALSGTVVPGLRGRVGNGALFDGAGAVSIAGASQVGALTSGYAIMGWVKPQDGASLQRLIAAGRRSSTNGFGFGLNNGQLLLSAFGVRDYQSSATVANNTWQHVAVVVDQSYNASFYLDGKFIDVIAGSGPTLANGDDTLYLGATTAAGGSALSERYTGQLDELYVYGRALSAAEISHAYYNQFRWFRKQHDSTFTVDTDAPTIELLNDATHWPNDYIQLSVATSDATSSVWAFEYGLKAPGASAFTWQSAPACEDARAGVLWCPSIDPTAGNPLGGGEGTYELQFRATDAVGNETTSPSSFIVVDDTPPTAGTGYSDSWLEVSQLAVDDLSWSVGLTGTISDPAIGSMAGSGVISSTVLVALRDSRGEIPGGSAQLATLSGDTWSIDYQLIGPRPTGRYTIELSASDSVGSAMAGQVVGSILLDARAPSIDVAAETLPVAVISTTTTLRGVLSEQPAPSGAVARFHFEEASGALSFVDSSGTLGDAVCAGTCPTATSGLFGGALGFAGSASLTVPATTALDLDRGTISVWVRPTWVSGANGYAPTILALGNGNGTRYSLHIGDGYGTLLLDNGSSVSALPMTLVPNEWQHIALVQSGQGWTGYLDGVAAGAVAQPFGTSSGAPLQIGSSGGSAERFRGDIDQLQIFDRELTDDEVYALAQSHVAGVAQAEVWLEPADILLPVTSTLASLDFEDPSASATFADDSGSGRSASCANCPAVVAGQFGQAIQLDGINDTLAISGAASLGLSRFTQAAWIYPTNSDTAFHGILGHDPGSTVKRAPSLYIFQRTRVQAGFGDGASWNSFSTSGGITPNAWNHVAATFDGTTYRIYINGVQRATANFAGKAPYPISQLNIGKVDNFFRGSLDRVRIFDRALSAQEVGMLASSWQPATLSAAGTPQAAWEYQLPAGMENLYQLRLRGSDQHGSTGSDRIVWRGMVDDLAPRVQLSATHAGGGFAASTIYTITAADTFLDPALITPCDTWETAATSHAWSGQTISLTQTCQVAGHRQGAVSATAYDVAGNTKTATVTLGAPTSQPGILITSPAGTLAGTTPISVTGGAYAPAGIQQIRLSANGAPVGTFGYGAGNTDVRWATSWTPQASGVYTLTAAMTVQGGGVYTDTATITVVPAYELTVQRGGSGTGTVTSSPGGIDCGADCAETLVSGTVITLTATPDANATFSGWSGACSGTGACVLLMSQAHSVAATFILRSATATATIPPTPVSTPTSTVATATATVPASTATSTVPSATSTVPTATVPASTATSTVPSTTATVPTATIPPATHRIYLPLVIH